MKIDRRSFLALGVGAAAGTALSPLPWKLTDDSSIWTQNWPWTPVPEDGEVTYENSVCTLCPGGCGITVRKVKDRIVKIEGTKGHPINDGGICGLGISGTQLLYGPGRVKSPLKRVGKRGEGKWQKISWEEAVGEVVSKLKQLQEDKKTDSIACISGNDKDITAQLFNRLLMALGSPNFTKTPSMHDSFRAVLKNMHGITSNGEIGYDFENADFVLSFGSGIIEGWGSPVRMCQINSEWKNSKTKMIQVEQRLSSTSAAADGMFSVNPGTEADLALGLACIIINENLYSKKFTGAFSTGFPEFKNMVNKYYNPDKVAKVTGMKRHMIIKLARHFALPSSKAIAVCGKGKGGVAGNMKEFTAVHSLNALVGNINMKGGVFAVETDNHIKWVKDVSPLARIDGKERIDEAGSDKYPDVKYRLHKLIEKINTEKESPVQALLVSKANPLYTMPDTQKTATAFEKIPFIVCFSTYMDETAEHSDLVLPDHNHLEKYEDVPVIAGLSKPLLELSVPVIKPLYDTMNSGDVVIKIAGNLGKRVSRLFKWTDYEDCLQKTLGSKWEELKSTGYITDKTYQPPAWGKAFGGTFSKFAFSGSKMKAPELAGKGKNYPLLLVPKESMRLAAGYIADPPFAMKTIPDTELKKNDVVVEINPVTARKFGLSDESMAELITPTGHFKVKITLFDGIMPDVIAMPKGLGHTAYNNFLKGKGINFNTVAGVVEDPVSGLDACWGTRATLSKV